MQWTKKSRLLQTDSKLGKHSLDRGQILDVASVHMIRGAEFFGERRDPFAKRVVLIGEGEIGSFCG